jgi:hypothetical protein
MGGAKITHKLGMSSSSVVRSVVGQPRHVIHLEPTHMNGMGHVNPMGKLVCLWPANALYPEPYEYSPHPPTLFHLDRF